MPLKCFNRFHIDPILAAVLALPVFFLFGMLVHWLLVRWLPKSDTPTLASLLLMFGFWLVLQNIAYAIWGNDDQSIFTPANTVGGPHRRTDLHPKVNLVVFAAAVFCMVVLQIVFHRSWFGRSMRALIQNPYAAQIVGVDDQRTARLTFGLGTAFAGFAGALLGMLYSFSPDFGRPFLLRSFVIIVLGGLESVSGVALGAIVLAVLETFGIDDSISLVLAWLETSLSAAQLSAGGSICASGFSAGNHAQRPGEFIQSQMEDRMRLPSKSERMAQSDSAMGAAGGTAALARSGFQRKSHAPSISDSGL